MNLPGMRLYRRVGRFTSINAPERAQSELGRGNHTLQGEFKMLSLLPDLALANLDAPGRPVVVSFSTKRLHGVDSRSTRGRHQRRQDC
jgi:hypothetical protein